MTVHGLSESAVYYDTVISFQWQTFLCLCVPRLSLYLNHSNSRLTNFQELFSHFRLNIFLQFKKVVSSQTELNSYRINLPSYNL
jgi:hypothetical protein